MELKKVEIDEIELALELLKANHPELINNSTYQEIADLIQVNFGYYCTRCDVFLIHEPTIEEDRVSLMVHYSTLGLI